MQERRASQLDGLGDESRVCNIELGDHDAADVVFGVGDEFRDEDVVVDRVADAAADDADGERQCRDGGD